MNKNILVGLAVSALALVAASSSAVANNAAFVIDNGGCVLPDQDFVPFWADADHTVVTSSGKGNLKCYATGVANDTGKAIRFSGFGCQTSAGYTERSWAVIDTEGNETMTCQVK